MKCWVVGGRRASFHWKLALIDPDDAASAIVRDRGLGDALRAFISRLAALIPPPRANLVTYHGLLAPAVSYREHVAPAAQVKPQPQCGESQEVDAPGSQVQIPEQRRSRMLWAEAMKRGLGLDVLTCEHCGGKREVLKCITDPKVITRQTDTLHFWPPPFAPGEFAKP